jgi:hypothetical protein
VLAQVFGDFAQKQSAEFLAMNTLDEAAKRFQNSYLQPGFIPFVELMQHFFRGNKQHCQAPTVWMEDC